MGKEHDTGFTKLHMGLTFLEKKLSVLDDFLLQNIILYKSLA